MPQDKHAPGETDNTDKWRNPVTSSLCSSLGAGLESHWLTFPFEGVSGLTGLPLGAVTPRPHGDAYTPNLPWPQARIPRH
ncbi:hypothetical protein E2C01_011207 [Portunus trituberculatus]|uniref:Uncharacterized protein n=1 Tax=Portunus trituberculatus TaxID=210409 RepID=A0A5B7DAG0_PORTR|nr:hypothetical protein [Portunus trituberculatus]